MKRVREERRKWAELNEDILRQVILRGLSRQDYFRFGAVCRPWSKVQRQFPPPIGPLPWFLFDCSYVSSSSSSDGDGVGNSSSTSTPTYMLYDPWEKEGSSFSCHMDVASEEEEEDEFVEEVLPAVYEEDNIVEVGESIIHLATSHGWLFMSKLNDSIESPFLRNPFTGSRIQLPLVSNQRHQFQLAQEIVFSLSAAPTDPDCVVVGYSSSQRLASCRLRDREEGWRYHAFNGSKTWIWKDVVFFNGSFYAIDHCGLLGVLDLPGMSTRILDMDGSIPLRLRTDNLEFEVHLVVSLGELLMVVADFKFTESGHPDIVIQVFRADLTAKTWEKVQSLGDRLLFLTKGDSISLSASAVGVPGNRVFLANSYYWHWSLEELDLSPKNNWCWMEYCLSDGRKRFKIDGTLAKRPSYHGFLWMMPSLEN